MIKIKNEISVRRLLFLISFSLSFTSLLIMSCLWIITEINQTKKTEKKVEKIILDYQKYEVKKHAEITVDYIKNMMKLKGKMPDDVLTDNILKFVKKLRFGFNGYVFINTYDGKALLYDGKIQNTEKSVLNNIDPEGNNIFRLEYDAAQKPGGDFIRYSFKKMTGNLPEPKIAYIKGIPEWKWIVGAGDYVVDAKKTLSKISSSMRKKLALRLSLISLLFVVFAIISYYISNLFSKFAISQLNMLLYHFKNPESNNEYIKKITIKELKSLAKEVSKIEKEKMASDEKLKDTLANMEAKVEERTAELKKQNEQLQKYNNLFVDREFRIKELRDEVERLKKLIDNKNN